MKRYFSILFLLILLNSCNPFRGKDIPPCLPSKIDEFDQTYNCDEAKVDCYRFQNEYVYVFDPGVCQFSDMQSEVVDNDCNTIGFLGGIVGNQVINNENFFENAQYVETVWEK